MKTPTFDSDSISENAAAQKANLNSSPLSNQPVGLLALGALGIVFGDIGTSPLYALRECFTGPHSVPLNHDGILGVLSLVIWSLFIVVSIKYVGIIMRADNRGEGGIMALMSLAANAQVASLRRYVIPLGVFGAALLYGDGVITPAISVLSAVEGLKIAAPHLGEFVVPLTLVILFILFSFQRQGTERIGRIFGPVLLFYFIVIAFLGAVSAARHPEIFGALNPYYAIRMFQEDGRMSFLVLGSVFLVTTGGEALYADMGHFGRTPIRLAWFSVVLPALLLNYFGQAAALLDNPQAITNPFFALAPSWATLPLVILSTLATIIASQALISGVFSITRQAIQLNFFPRMKVIFTSNENVGQIYVPAANFALMLASMWLVIHFQSSSNLAAAYGISVSLTMVITTLLMYVVARHLWGWSRLKAMVICGSLICVDTSFVFANVVKIAEGGWFPLVVGAIAYGVMRTWNSGRQLLVSKLQTYGRSLQDFIKYIQVQNTQRTAGTAVYLTGVKMSAPTALVNSFKHTGILNTLVIVMTIENLEVPKVPEVEQMIVNDMGNGFIAVTVFSGFTQETDVPSMMARLKDIYPSIVLDEIHYYISFHNVLQEEGSILSRWQHGLFRFMNRNALRATDYFKLPHLQTIEIGTEIEL